VNPRKFTPPHWKNGRSGRENAGRKALTKAVAAQQSFAIFRPLLEQFGGAGMAHDTDYQPGSMDISQHKKTYAGFLTFTKWSFAGIMLIMILLAMFRTG
jgi:hypothetical protein